MRAEHLTVRYGDLLALDDVTLEIPAGQVTAVVGADGAGKTTLLNAVVGLVAATGSVDTPPAQDIGFMPAGSGSWADLTVAENVAFVGGAYGLTGSDLAQRADRLLRAAGLDSVPDRLAGQLSGGMHTKLGFCLAMLHEPSLLVLDEPSTGVDPVSRVELWRLISEAAARGTAVLMSTTYIDEAERTNNVVVLQQGRVLLQGSPDDIIAACPGTVVATATPSDPQYAWRSGSGYRQWLPASSGPGQDVTLEDVCIVASLRGAR